MPNRKNLKHTKIRFRVKCHHKGQDQVSRTPVYFAKNETEAHQWIHTNGDPRHVYHIESGDGVHHGTKEFSNNRWIEISRPKWTKEHDEDHPIL